jgi:hypothetical protein
MEANILEFNGVVLLMVGDDVPVDSGTPEMILLILTICWFNIQIFVSV